MPSIAVPAMPNFAVEEPPLFATQGEDVGKKRGRRPRTAADTPDPASGKRGSAPKAKAKAKAMAAKAKAKAKAKACASRGSKQAAPKASSRPAPKVKAKAKASAKSKQGRAKALAVERYRANMALEGEGAAVGVEAVRARPRGLPSHVTANHCYSSAYRKAQGLGLSIDECRARGQAAAEQFRKDGACDPSLVGTPLGLIV